MNSTLSYYKDANGNTIKIELGDILIHLNERNGRWIAFSPQFKSLGFSKSSETEAIKDLKDAIDTFFDVHLERGTLETALRQFGWKKEQDTFKKPKYFNTPAFSDKATQRTLKDYAYANA